MLKTLVFLVAIAFAAHLKAADVSGKWVGDMSSGNTVGNPTARVFLTLEVSGDAVSGSLAYQDESKLVQIEKPVLHGDQLTFELHDNPTRIVTFKLTISANALRGSASSGERTIKIALARPN
jgi:hypothetical protein